MANLDGAHAGPAVGHELLAWAGGTSTREPFLGGDLAGYAGRALGQVGAAYAETSFDALLSRIPHVSGTEALHIVGETLRMAFPNGPTPADTPFTALDNRQRRLVQALAGSPDAWMYNGMDFGNLILLVQEYGLPHSCRTLRTYMEPML